MANNEFSLRFCIWDFEEISHEDISNSLGLPPIKIYVRGEKVPPKFGRISKRNGWIYGTPYGNMDDFETQMNKLLDVLEPRINVLREYSKKYSCDFSLAYFCNDPDYPPPLIHLGRRYHDFVRVVEAEFDLDLYYSPLDDE